MQDVEEALAVLAAVVVPAVTYTMSTAWRNTMVAARASKRNKAGRLKKAAAKNDKASNTSNGVPNAATGIGTSVPNGAATTNDNIWYTKWSHRLRNGRWYKKWR